MDDNVKTDAVCPYTKNDSCPPGFFIEMCEDTASRQNAYKCTPCPPGTHQEHENWVGDTCKLNRRCQRSKNLITVNNGSASKDAQCGCIPGYHAATEMFRYCTRNRQCGKGSAPATVGDSCERCLDKGMYSDTVGHDIQCKPLTKCHVQQRCITVQSDGTRDHVCGPRVEDLSACENIATPARSDADVAKVSAPLGLVLGLLVVAVLVFVWRRPQYRRRNQNLSGEVTEEQARESRVSN